MESRNTSQLSSNTLGGALASWWCSPDSVPELEFLLPESSLRRRPWRAEPIFLNPRFVCTYLNNIRPIKTMLTAQLVTARRKFFDSASVDHGIFNIICVRLTDLVRWPRPCIRESCSAPRGFGGGQW